MNGQWDRLRERKTKALGGVVFLILFSLHIAAQIFNDQTFHTLALKVNERMAGEANCSCSSFNQTQSAPVRDGQPLTGYCMFNSCKPLMLGLNNSSENAKHRFEYLHASVRTRWKKTRSYSSLCACGWTVGIEFCIQVLGMGWFEEPRSCMLFYKKEITELLFSYKQTLPSDRYSSTSVSAQPLQGFDTQITFVLAAHNNAEHETNPLS